jgi:hypothetical protein
MVLDQLAVDIGRVTYDAYSYDSTTTAPCRYLLLIMGPVELSRTLLLNIDQLCLTRPVALRELVRSALLGFKAMSYIC